MKLRIVTWRSFLYFCICEYFSSDLFLMEARRCLYMPPATNSLIFRDIGQDKPIPGEALRRPLRQTSSPQDFKRRGEGRAAERIKYGE